MKKNTFYALLFLGILTGCAVIEGTGSNSAEIEQAQAESIETMYKESGKTHTDSEIFDELAKVNPNATPEEIEGLNRLPVAYQIILNDDKIMVVDPETNKIILTEDYDTRSELAEAILKDNE